MGNGAFGDPMGQVEEGRSVVAPLRLRSGASLGPFDCAQGRVVGAAARFLMARVKSGLSNIGMAERRVLPGMGKPVDAAVARTKYGDSSPSASLWARMTSEVKSRFLAGMTNQRATNLVGNPKPF